MLVERKPVSINAIDFTACFSDVGYEVEYIKRTGSNGGMMQDGSIAEDVLAIKAVITLPCVPLSEEQLSNVLSEVLSTSYPIVGYYDPWRKTVRTVQTVASVSRQKYRGIGSDGRSYWTGTVLTLTEK